MSNKIAELEKLAYTAANGNMSRSQAKVWARKAVNAARGADLEENPDGDISGDDLMSCNKVLMNYLSICATGRPDA